MGIDVGLWMGFLMMLGGVEMLDVGFWMGGLILVCG